jgi:hypothetical protein
LDQRPPRWRIFTNVHGSQGSGAGKGEKLRRFSTPYFFTFMDPSLAEAGRPYGYIVAMMSRTGFSIRPA